MMPNMASALNSTATQQVTVTVVPGFLNIYSPEEGRIYQENNIPVDIQVQTSLDIAGIIIIDNSDLSYLCSKCKSYSEERYFSDGKHDIVIRIDFDNNESVEKHVSFIVDSKSNIYIHSNGILKKATSKNIADYLLHYNFTISHKDEAAPDDSCSVRAKSKNASLNFYSITSIEQGQGTLSGKINKKTFSLNFKVNKTIESSDNFLILNIEGRKKEKAVLEFDKLNNKVKVTGANFSFDNLGVYFVKGCSAKKQNFYLLEKGNRITRSIEDIRKLLDENPVFIGRYENLRIFYNQFWWRFNSFLV